MKGPRLVTQQKVVLAGIGNFIKRFFASGLAELELGWVLQQLHPSRNSRPRNFRRFLDHLPRASPDGLQLNHVIEARHASFASPEFVKLMRETDKYCIHRRRDWPSIADITGDVVYARLQRGDDALAAAYKPKALDAWAERAKLWARAACRTIGHASRRNEARG